MYVGPSSILSSVAALVFLTIQLKLCPYVHFVWIDQTPAWCSLLPACLIYWERNLGEQLTARRTANCLENSSLLGEQLTARTAVECVVKTTAEHPTEERRELLSEMEYQIAGKGFS